MADHDLPCDGSGASRPEATADRASGPPGALLLVDVFVDWRGETIALVNTKRSVWTDRAVGHDWMCTNATTGEVHRGRVLPIEAHGHTAVVTFGRGPSPGATVRLSNHGQWYGERRLGGGVLRGRHFLLTAAVFIRLSAWEEVEALGRWMQWHAALGVEHCLIYVNSPEATDAAHMERLRQRFPTNVTFVPFWFGHGVAFGDQQAASMHALYTLKGVSKWMLSIDVDEYVFIKPDLRSMLRAAPPGTHAFQFGSYTVSADGVLSGSPQYQTPLKGKVILNTETATGHSVHMVTDAIGGRREYSDVIEGNHRHVPPGVGLLAHFHRTAEVARLVDVVFRQYA